MVPTSALDDTSIPNNVDHKPNCVGRVPVKEFSDKSTNCNDVMTPKSDGIVPFILFRATLRYSMDLQFESVGGRVPVRSVLLKSIRWTRRKSPNLDGMDPPKLFSSKRSHRKSGMSPRDSGTVPVKILFETQMYCSDVNASRFMLSKFPVKALSCSDSVVRLVRPPRDDGTEPQKSLAPNPNRSKDRKFDRSKSLESVPAKEL